MPDEKDLKKPDPPETDKEKDLKVEEEPSLSPEELDKLLGQGEEVLEGEEEEKEIFVPPELKELMVKKGFKSPGEVVQAYNEMEKKTTSLSQDTRLLNLFPAQVPERQRENPPEIKMPELPDSPYNMTKEEYQGFLDKRDEAVEAKLRHEYEEDKKDVEYKSAYKDLYAKIMENPEEFKVLQPTMYNLSLQYPNASITQLYNESKKMVTEDRKQKSEDLWNDLFGEDVDKAQVKALLSKVRPVQISTGSGGGQEGARTTVTRKQAEDALKKSILNADKIEEKSTR